MRFVLRLRLWWLARRMGLRRREAAPAGFSRAAAVIRRLEDRDLSAVRCNAVNAQHLRALGFMVPIDVDDTLADDAFVATERGKIANVAVKITFAR